MPKLESKKEGIYYCRLGIEKDSFNIAKSVDCYIRNRNEKVTSVEAILESFSVLSNSELKRIYDSFVEKDLEGDFLTLIGSQFRSFYDYYDCLLFTCDNEEDLLKLSEGKKHYLEKSLSEKVLKIAKKLEELEKEGVRFFTDDKKALTRDTAGTLFECFWLEKESSIEFIESECRGKNYVEKEIQNAFFGLLYLISLREDLIFSCLSLMSRLDIMKEKFTFLRFFAVGNPLNCLKSFSEDLLEVVDSNKSNEKNTNIKNEMDRFLSISKKFLDNISEYYNKKNKGLFDDKGESELLCSEKYNSLILLVFEQFHSAQKEEINYRKAWKDACDFLETYEKRFLESSPSSSEKVDTSKIVVQDESSSSPSSSEKVDTSKIVVQDESSSSPSSSEKVDTSKIVVQDERGTFFEDRWGVILSILILVIIFLGLPGWWIYKKNKSKK